MNFNSKLARLYKMYVKQHFTKTGLYFLFATVSLIKL